MTRILRFLGIAAAAAALAGCTTFAMSGIQMGSPGAGYTEVAEFDREVWVHEFLGTSGGSNIFNISSDAMDDEITDIIALEVQKNGGDAAIDVTVEYQSKFGDMFLNALTQSIYAPAHAVVSGTVIRYE